MQHLSHYPNVLIKNIGIMKKLLLNLLPLPVKRSLLAIKEKQELQISAQRRKEQQISKNEIEKILQSFNLDCDIFLHTSLRHIGYEIEGGKEYVADIVSDITKLNEHTLLVSALPFRTTMKEYLDVTPTLDMRTAPNAMGAVNNIIMAKNNAFRSIHPTHSVVAIGRDARQYTINHHLDITPFGVNSPYYKLMLNHGKILLFGVDLSSMTFTHVVEDMIGDMYPVDVYVKNQYTVDVTDFDGTVKTVVTKCHNPNISAIRNCESIRQFLIDGGAMQTKKLGHGEVSIVDAVKYNQVVCRLLLDGKSIYGDVLLTSEAKARVEQIIKELENI